MLYKQSIADVLENGPPASIDASFFGELPREWLYDLEYGGNFPLIAGENDTLGQRIGDDD